MNAVKLILGQKIVGIYESINQDFGGLDEAEVFIQLENEELFEFPIQFTTWHHAEPEAIRGLENVKEELFNNHDCVITDIIKLNEYWEDIYVELVETMLFTLDSVAPNGSMAAGIITHPNLDSFEKREGTNYRRLSR